MSKTTKKRFVTKQILMELILPSSDEIIAQVIASRGCYLLEVQDANGEIYLASMPAKFRNTVWVKRGNFVILLPIKEGYKVCLLIFTWFSILNYLFATWFTTIYIYIYAKNQVAFLSLICLYVYINF